MVETDIKKEIEQAIRDLGKDMKTTTDENIKKEEGQLLMVMEGLMSLIRGFENKENLTENGVKKIQGVTCFGHLAYCCSVVKECYKRDTVLYLLGIEKDEFEGKKREVVDNWLKEYEKKR